MKGRYWKEDKLWIIEVPEIDVRTQGESEKEALEMIADAIECVVDIYGFKMLVTQTKVQKAQHTFTIEPDPIWGIEDFVRWWQCCPAGKKAGGKAGNEMGGVFVIGEGVDIKGCQVVAQGPAGVVVQLPGSQTQLLIPAEYIHHHRVEEGKMEPDVCGDELVEGG